MQLSSPLHSNSFPLRPLCGSLYKRRGGRYLSAKSPEYGLFWFDYRLPGLKGHSMRIALNTADYATAYCRAQAIVIQTAHWADEIFLRDKLEAQIVATCVDLPALLPRSSAHPRSASIQSALEGRIALEGLWEAVKPRYDVRAKSLETYRQQTAKFAKYAVANGLHFADEVTRLFAENYARWLYPRVTTADKHIACLRREWQLLFPDAPVNPWNLSIRLSKKERNRAMNYRPLTLNEMRRIRQTIARVKRDRTPVGGYRRLLTDALLDDMDDALVLCYHYGLRIGSLEAVDWGDFDRQRGIWRHRPPKTSRATLGNDYPILSEVEGMLVRRLQRGEDPKGNVFKTFSQTHRTNEQVLNLAIKAIFKVAKVTDSSLKGRATWHSLRATFITRLTENGCPIAIVKELAQHAKADMTQRYVHTSIATNLRWLQTLPDLGDVDLDADYPTEPELPDPHGL